MQTAIPSEITTVVIEPSEPDRHWLRIMLAESGLPHSIREFATCVEAIQALAEPDTSAVDIVFVTIAPPMFEIGEAIRLLSSLPALSQARFAVTVIDQSEMSRVPAGCYSIMKPASAEDIQRFATNPEAGNVLKHGGPSQV